MILELIRFKKIADIGSITKASKLLFITQPALTQSMHRLEKELGTKLLDSSGKRTSLTENGKIIYSLAERMIQLWTTAKTLRKSDDYKPYSIGLFDNAALQLSSYLKNKLKDKKLEIVIDRSENLLKKIQYGLLDICVCIKPKDLSQFPNALLVKTYKEKLIPVTKVLWKKPLEQIPFILYDKDSQTQYYIDKIFVEHGIQPKIAAESVNPLFMKELALKSCGVAILPENMIAQDIKKKRLLVQSLPFLFERTCGIFQNKECVSQEIKQILNEIAAILL